MVCEHQSPGRIGTPRLHPSLKRPEVRLRELARILRLNSLEELDYPFHDKTITVTQCGRVCFGRQKIHLSTVFAGQNVGIKEVADKIWLVSFMHYDLGFFDHETCRLGSAENPFGAKVLPMSPV
jgi:hypothetical protein